MPLSFAEWKRMREEGSNPNRKANIDLGTSISDPPFPRDDVILQRANLAMASYHSSRVVLEGGAGSGWAQNPPTPTTSEDKQRRSSQEGRRSHEWKLLKDEEFGGVPQMATVDPTFLDRSLLVADKGDKWALEPPTRRSSVKRIHLRRNKTDGLSGSVRVGVRVIEARLASKDLSDWQKFVRCELLVTDAYDDKDKVSFKVKGHTSTLSSDKTKSVKRCRNPRWDEFYRYELQHPEKAHLAITLVSRRSTASIGTVRGRICESLLEWGVLSI
mmetsp:Transcript_10035/g.20946  ORF Transcript_10035/g.20946 Transcript_10035/m.20946 type:complete len:272 (-) Transcript_10035:4-819(-)